MFQPRRRSHWLCVAYAFPPINRSGTHRTLGFVKHLDAFGWEATVLTVEPRDESLDPLLLDEVPASTVIVRTPWSDLVQRAKALCGINETRSREASTRTAVGRVDAPGEHPAEAPRRTFREFVSRLLITPDSRAGWIVPAVRAGMRAVRYRRPDVIYSTSPYMSAHLIALLLSRRTGLPWVADFRDPWCDNPFRELGFRSIERWDGWLENRVLRRATRIVCNTSTMQSRLCDRVPFVTDKCTTIMNGFDGVRFENITPARTVPRDDFLLTHVGQFYGPRSPLVWFSALRSALDESPRNIVMALVGPPAYEGRPLEKIAEAAGVAANVNVIGRRGHAEALSYLAGSDALMLAGSAGPDGDLQVPNKLFEYLAIRKPVIATASPGSPVVSILDDARVPSIVCDPADDAALADAILRMARNHPPVIENAWVGVERFDRARRAEQLAAVFEDVATAAYRSRARPVPAPVSPALRPARPTPGY